MGVSDLDVVVRIEEVVYFYFWMCGNFQDLFYSGYQVQILWDVYGELLGYFLVMLVVDEVYLFNISVVVLYQYQGLGCRLLDQVIGLVCQYYMWIMLLEVCEFNVYVVKVYCQYGFIEIGWCKNYYFVVNQI